MNYGIYAITPYQVLASMFYVLTETNNDDIVDIYIDIDSYKGMSFYAENLKKSGICRNVYITRNPRINKKGIDLLRVKLKEWFFPQKSFIYSLDGERNDVNIADSYDIVLIATPNMNRRNFAYYYSSAKLFFYDDGVGNYQGDIKDQYTTWKSAFLQKVFRRGPGMVKPEKYYLYRPDFYEGPYTEIICKLNTDLGNGKSSQLMSCLEKVFGKDEERIYEKYRYIYLDHALRERDGDIVRNAEVRNCIIGVLDEELKDSVICRPHPQMDVKDLPLKVDQKGYIWELVCADQIRDESVLISKYSTSQLIPKLLYDKEPFLIFTYKLFAEITQDFMIEKSEAVVNRLKSIYTKPERILCPETIEELKESIKMK